MKNKKAFEMNFAWIFSIIVGSIILFLAIYAATQFVRTERYKLDTETAAKLAILLDPLETSLEAGKSKLLAFSTETRIYNKCDNYGSFGKQTIKISTKQGIGKEWQEPGGDTKLYNKYIFSKEIEEGKEFSVFTKPLKMPFKISDLIFFSGQAYCFVDAPEDIKDELKDFMKNVNFTGEKLGCKGEKIVCFGQSSGCDIAVYSSDNFKSGYVSKEGKRLYYEGPLIYGAIFSSAEIYECNIERLMSRLINLALIYKEKIKILEKKGCSSVLDSHLSELISLARNSPELSAVSDKAEEMERINDAADCKLW